jgi:RecB family exonuclease
MAWIGPAFVPDIAERVAEGSGVTESGVKLTVVLPEDLDGGLVPAPRVGEHSASAAPFELANALEPPPRMLPAPPVSTLSYSSLGEHRRCGYRFYVERVLGLPQAPARGASRPEGLSGTERGIVLHTLLEQLDFRRPVRPTNEAIAAAAQRAGLAVPAAADELADRVEAFGSSPLCSRLARAGDVRREERFSFPLEGGVLVNGAIDVLAREQPGRMLVIDYKSDRLEGADPAQVVAGEYATQRLLYAIAVLRAGAAAVEVVHVFLEAPERPVSAQFTRADAQSLERELELLAGGVLERRFPVSQVPHRALCSGCPAEGGLCSWPLELTRREAPDRLF